jgi:hypothetical protein
VAGHWVVGRGQNSFPLQLNLSDSVRRITQLTLSHECVLELLKLSSNVNECKLLLVGRDGAGVGCQYRARSGQATDDHEGEQLRVEP